MAQTADHTARNALRRYLVAAAIVFVAYYVAGKLGQATTEIRSSNLGPVWPAYGVALAAVLFYGPRIWPAIAASAFVVAFQSDVLPITAVGQAVAATLGALVGGALLQWVGFDRSMSRLHDALSLIIIGALVSAIVSASLGVAVLYATGVQAYSGIGPAWLVYWLGDSTGVLLVTPLALTGSRLFALHSPRCVAEFAALVLLLVTACLVIFTDIAFMPLRLHVLAFAVLPFIIWAAIRFGVSGVSLATLLVAAIATVTTALGNGPFAHNTTFINAVLLDVFFTVLSVSGVTLAAVITEREHAEGEREQLIRKQAAVEERLRLAAVVDSSDDAILRQDAHGVVTDWNAGAQRLYGYAANEAIGNVFPDFVLPPGVKGADAARSLGVINKRETSHIRKDGTRIQVSLTVSAIKDAAGHIVGASAIARDVTERERAAAALRESEDKLRLILNSVAEGIFGIDGEGRCTFCNQACLRALGYERGEALIGQHVHTVIHHSRPDGRDRTADECRLLDVLKTGRAIHADEVVLWKADGTGFPAEWWSYPQWQEGRVVGAVVGFSDITQRKHAEAKASRLQEELAHLNRVGMLSALTGALAHEINQPLAAVRINTEAAQRLLAVRPPSISELRDTLNEIQSDNRRAGDVLERVRALLKKDATTYEEVEINSTVSDVVRLMHGSAAKRGILIDMELAPAPLCVWGDRVQIQQVVLNLLMNACDAVERNEGSLRRVSLRTIARKEGVSVEVRDRGPGLADGELDRIFEPFYTTKDDGMGLGLSICRAIVATHGGTLEASRNPDAGMTFIVKVPVGQPSAIRQARAVGQHGWRDRT